MIRNDSKHSNRFFLLTFETTTNESDNLISTVGYQDITPQREYPTDLIPKRYGFDLGDLSGKKSTYSNSLELYRGEKNGVSTSPKGRRLAEYQLVYITGGLGMFQDEEGSHLVVPGTMILLRPGYRHSYQPNKDIGWTEYFIGFNGPEFKEAIETFFGDEKGPIELGLSATIVDLYEQALFYAERQNSQTMPLMKSIVLHIIALMNYNLCNKNKENDKVTEAVNKVKHYMTAHIAEQIDVEKLAESMGMSYTWLRRMFKKNTGLAPAQYLQRQRIHSSMYYLRNSTLPVKNIAFECGFKTAEYFCSVFLAFSGMSPGAYRQMYAEQ